MYNAFWRFALFVRGQSFSVKTFDRSRNGCQVIREGAGNVFRGPSVQALPLPSRVSFSRARFFLCPLLPSACYTGYIFNCCFNLTCYYATAGIPPGFAVLFVLGGLLTTPWHTERDNSPSQSSWSNLYMCFASRSFQEQNWFPSIFQNWCVVFDSSCIILIKLVLSYLLLVCA